MFSFPYVFVPSGKRFVLRILLAWLLCLHALGNRFKGFNVPFHVSVMVRFIDLSIDWRKEN